MTGHDSGNVPLVRLASHAKAEGAPPSDGDEPGASGSSCGGSGSQPSDAAIARSTSAGGGAVRKRA